MGGCNQLSPSQPPPLGVTPELPGPGFPPPPLIPLQLFSWAHSWALSHSHVWRPRLLPTTLRPDRSL